MVFTNCTLYKMRNSACCPRLCADGLIFECIGGRFYLKQKNVKSKEGLCIRSCSTLITYDILFATAGELALNQ